MHLPGLAGSFGLHEFGKMARQRQPFPSQMNLVPVAYGQFRDLEAGFDPLG